MNKKLVLLLSTTLTASICLGVVMVAVHHDNMFVRGDLTYSIDLSDKSKVEEIDYGYLHEISVKNNKFDMLGWSSTGGEFGSIKQVTYGDYTFNGMIYNRSVINGFESLSVKFSGGKLYYVLTDFLMENMEFDKTLELISETPVDVPNNEGYFVVYTDEVTPVNIDYVRVSYQCDASIDNEMIFNKNSDKGSARSWSKADFEDSFVELENNPQKYTNNYSVGTHYYCNDCKYEFATTETPEECPHCHGTDIERKNSSSWYRWNGRFFANSADLGNTFSFGMTIAGNISQVVGAHAQKEDNYFHLNVWPQFTFGDTEDDREANAEYEMIYIGNDNYEPLGHEHQLTPRYYNNQAYEGRFFTVYENCEWHIWSNSREDEYKVGGVAKSFATKEAARAFIKLLPEEEQSDWRAYAYDAAFLDPDTNTVVGSSITLRDAYEAYNLPFWFVKFDVYMQENDIGEVVPFCDAYINGFKMFTSEIFYEYDIVNNPGVQLYRLQMHLVNYGVDAEGNPAHSYKGTFTYPRLITE